MAAAKRTIKAFYDCPKYPIDILIAVDIQDQSSFTIEAQERLGIGGKHLEPVCHDVLGIVDASLLDSPREQSPREFRERDFKMHHCLQLNRRSLLRHPVSRLGLVEVSWESIEHIPAIAGRLNQRLSEYLEYQVVRYQIAPPNVLDCLPPYFGICCNFVTQQLPARKVRDPVVVSKLGCLGALARTGRGD
jgi:hypothetical protein